jgi:fluoroacetyl-CoA thioesterase
VPLGQGLPNPWEERMKDSLTPGIRHELCFPVPETKTVPHLYPEAPEFQAMPRVFATGFMVGLVEWACIQAVNPHLDWPREQTVGTHVDLSHSAATPPGLEVCVRVHLVKVEGRRVVFEVEANDGVDVISRGTHERVVVDAERFASKAWQKSTAGG